MKEDVLYNMCDMYLCLNLSHTEVNKAVFYFYFLTVVCLSGSDFNLDLSPSAGQNLVLQELENKQLCLLDSFPSGFLTTKH